HLPHGVIGLLLAVILSASMSSTSSELSALASTSAIDFYKTLLPGQHSEAHFVWVSRLLTLFWGLMAIGFALMAHLVENLIEAVNIVGSLF
ncbi:MAG: sodium:solute symporter, partial [Cytophagales bacterium]|nr:sodium:solute symporter [Cytophagales bacterium]